jgi:chromate reductase, NAD(P)H dehydrogenase (quinone)
LPNILTVCGSLRVGSFNRALMNALPDLAPTGMQFREAPSVGDIPHFNADLMHAGAVPKAVSEFAEAVHAADGVVFVSPEYNWTIPGALKNALDWVSRVGTHPFAKKPVAIQSAAAGQLGGSRMQYHLRMALTYLDAFVFGTPEVFVAFAPSKFDPSTLALTDEGTKKAVAAQLQAFSKFIELVGHKQEGE